MKLDLDQLRDLIRLLDESNLTEIEVEHDDDRIRVRRDPAPLAAQSVIIIRVKLDPPSRHAE